MTAKALTEEEELAILFPEPVVFPIGARLKIELLPMDTATCARFANKARPIIKAALASSSELVAAVIVGTMDYPDEAIAALSIATGKPVEFIGRIPPPITRKLIEKIFEINADFFDQSAAAAGSGALVKSPDPVPVGVGPTH